MYLLSLLLEILFVPSGESVFRYAIVKLKSGDFFPEGSYYVTERVYDEAENFASNEFNIYVRESK